PRAPNLVPILWIVSDHRTARRADDLCLPIDPNRQRCAERESPARAGVPRFFPEHFPVRFVQRDDVRIARAIATEDQRVIHENGRTSWAMDGWILEIRVAPKNFSVQIERSCSVLAK